MYDLLWPTDNQPVKVVQQVKEVLKTPENWVKKYYALNKSGEKVHADDPGACQWCLMGAIRRAHLDLGMTWFDRQYHRAMRAIEYQVQLREFPTMGRFNDDPAVTYEQVIEVLDAAIVRLRDMRTWYK